MAARRRTGRKWFEHYPDVRARTTTTWQTRQGRRNREFASFSNLLGLNTTFDDLHKKDGESPFLRNVRYMGEKQESQRTQVTSRNGARFLQSIGDINTYPTAGEATTYLDLREGQAREFDIDFADVLIGGMMFIQNIDKARGVLRVMLKRNRKSRPICEAFIDLAKVNVSKYKQCEFRFIQTLIREGMPGAAGTIRLEILDDIDPENAMDSQPVSGRSIRILASNTGTHREATYQLPNTDESMREIPYEFTQRPNIPLFGIKTNPYKVMGRGVQVWRQDKRYLVFPASLGSVNQLWRYNFEENTMTLLDAPIHGDSTVVRFALADGYVYYVDGHSRLQRINVTTWQSEIAIADSDDIDVAGVTPASLQAKAGASLIYHLRSRLVLSGFADDPNLVQMSLINSTGPQFDQYNEGFYSPDRSPSTAAYGPITAFAQVENSLAIFRTDGNSLFSAPTGLEFGKAQQVDSYAWNIGVQRQEDIAEGNGNIWFYNRSEGFRRYAGTDSSFNSSAVDNELRRITPDSDRFMLAHGNKVRFWFDREQRGKADHALVFHTILSSQSPWYMDDNVPLKWAVGDSNSDAIYACHADYPAIYIVDDDNQFTDFDSPVVMQYHTQYRSPGELSGYTILRRVLSKVIENHTHSWFIGVDFDHKNQPAVWRKVVQGRAEDIENPESIFDDTAEPGSQTLNLFMRAKCRDMQIRYLVYVYKGSAELLYAEGQYGGKMSL
jgi:hypothetical protein